MALDNSQLKDLILSTKVYSASLVDILLYNIRYKEKENAIILAINNLLTNTKTRVKGLELVSAILPYCTREALTEHVITWASHCVVHYSNENIKEIKLKTLANIIETIPADIEGFNKKFVSDFLLDTLKACLDSQKDSEDTCALKCLTQCMKRYPSWFGNHKNKVEPFILRFLELQSKNTNEASLAFISLQQTGSAGVEGINYVNNFSLQLKKLCVTVHSLYDTFFENINEIDNTDPIEAEPFAFTPLGPDTNATAILQDNSVKIINCLHFIKTMLTKRFPVEKQIVSKNIVDLISRGLSVHICLMNEREISHETISHSQFLKDVQIQLLKLLHVFIIGYFPVTLPFAHIINKILMNCVRRIQSCDCYNTNLVYQENVYKTLNYWLISTRGLHQPHLHTALIPMLLKNICPVTKKVSLNLNVRPKGKQKKRNKAVINLDETQVDEKVYLFDQTLQEKKCLFALRTLLSVLMTSLNIDKEIFKDLVSSVVKILNDIQTGRVVCPYTSIMCQGKLYEILVAFLQHENFHLIPIQLVCTILHGGLHSINQNVAKACYAGLQVVESISQPVCPSLNISTINEQSTERQIVKSEEIIDYAMQQCQVNLDESTEENGVVEEHPKPVQLQQESNHSSAITTIELEETDSQESVVEVKPECGKSVSEITFEDDGVTIENNKKRINIISDVSINVNSNTDGLMEMKQIDGENGAPPSKKMKNDLISVEEMISSFQNVVQD